MKEIADQVLEYFQDNLLLTLAISWVAGYAAYKSVVHVKRGNAALFFIVGVLGSFLGQFAIRYFGLKEILDQVAEFALFFDLLAAYIGSFVLTAMIHFIRPL